MNINEVIQKIGESKLRAAMESGEASELKGLFQEEGIEISEEQLDYIAGGMSGGYFIDKDGKRYEFTDDDSCIFPGLSCLPEGQLFGYDDDE